MVGAAVVGRDAVQVLEQIGAERSEHIDTWGDTGVHLFLDERGMEVAGVERHQADLSHRAAALLGGEECPAERSGHEQGKQSGFHRSRLRC